MQRKLICIVVIIGTFTFCSARQAAKWRSKHIHAITYTRIYLYANNIYIYSHQAYNSFPSTQPSVGSKLRNHIYNICGRQIAAKAAHFILGASHNLHTGCSYILWTSYCQLRYILNYMAKTKFNRTVYAAKKSVNQILSTNITTHICIYSLLAQYTLVIILY